MLSKVTYVDRIDIDSTGAVTARLVLGIKDGDSLVASKYHRISFSPADDAQVVMAGVAEHLSQMGEAAVAEADSNRLLNIVAHARAESQ